MPQLLRALTFAAGLAVLVGCSGTASQSDPKVADPSKLDPRLKPADSGTGAQPLKGQGSLKGD